MRWQQPGGEGGGTDLCPKSLQLARGQVCEEKGQMSEGQESGQM